MTAKLSSTDCVMAFSSQRSSGAPPAIAWLSIAAIALVLAAADAWAQNYEVLHRFTGLNGDGAAPLGPLVEGPDGHFYGTTEQGGDGYCTVFKIDRFGNLTILHRFALADGVKPKDGLLRATNGDFYGTAYRAGTPSTGICSSGCGTVFKISAGGVFSLLHGFIGYSAAQQTGDGTYPIAGLIQGTDGPTATPPSTRAPSSG